MNSSENTEQSGAYRSLILHNNLTFEGVTLYVEGHRYYQCVIRNCTLVITSVGGLAEFYECVFEGQICCRIEVTVFDNYSLDQLIQLLHTFKQSYPSIEEIKANIEQQEGKGRKGDT